MREIPSLVFLIAALRDTLSAFILEETDKPAAS
jgi:hypothetical protein